jgi:2-phosphoglycolate phosphatase
MTDVDHSEIRWEWLHFHELSLTSLHRCMALRQEVFVIEQRCFYLDADDYDQGAFHLLGWRQDTLETDRLVAYLRAYPTQEGWKVGRVLVVEKERGRGLGEELMGECHAQLLKLGAQHISLAAQVQVVPFYEKLGYRCLGDIYPDAGIPHQDMKIDFADDKHNINQCFSTIIFDFDGTLVDSAQDYAVCFQTLAAEWNARLPRPSASVIRDLMFAGVKPQLEYALGPLNESEYLEALEHFRQVCMRTHLRHTVLYPGMKSVLDILKLCGHRLAICTNRPEDLCQQALQSLGISEYFEAVVGGDRGLARKPSPEMLHALFKTLDVSPADCLLVGDSKVDVTSARAAGCTPLVVHWGYTPQEEFTSLQPLMSVRRTLGLLEVCLTTEGGLPHS